VLLVGLWDHSVFLEGVCVSLVGGCDRSVSLAHACNYFMSLVGVSDETYQ